MIFFGNRPSVAQATLFKQGPCRDALDPRRSLGMIFQIWRKK
jgi:hypothetical protein